MFASKTHHRSQNISFKVNRAHTELKDAFVSHPLKPGGENRLLFRASKHFQLTTGHRFSKRAKIQWQASIEVLPRLRPLSGLRKRSPSSRNEVQAAGLVRTIRPILARRAEVAFFDQPDLGENELRVLHRALDDFLQERLHRPFLGNLQEQLRSEMRIEPSVAGRFHCRTLMTLLVRGKSQITVFRVIQFFEIGKPKP